MNTISTERRGSTRIMTSHGPGVIRVEYTNQFSVFDRGSSPQEIPALAESRCACAIRSFELMRDAGLRTHYLRQQSPRSFLAWEFKVPGKPTLSGTHKGSMIPLEWLWRDKPSGSVWLRTLLDPKHPHYVSAEQLGFPAGTILEKGMDLPRTFLSCTTKFEEVDRTLTDEEAQNLSQMTTLQWRQAQKLIRSAVSVIVPAFKRAGIDCADGKFELGLKNDGEIMIVDVAGTQDENRIVDAATGRSLCKDVLRARFEEMPWKAELDAAKAEFPHDKSKWPEYPILPDDFIQEVSAIYAEVAWRYAGVRVAI